MQMTPVVSSNVDSIGYENETLYVRFKNGSLYLYENVPSYQYDALMSASSKGSYLAQNIKGHYSYARIG